MKHTWSFFFHFLALLLFVVTQENRKVSMRSKLWWCEVQKSGIFGLFTGWIFFSLSSQGGAFVSQSNLDLSNLISFFSFSAFSGNFRHFLLHKFWQQRSGRRFLVCIWDSISKGYFGNNLTQMWDREVQNKTSRSKIWK